MGSPSVRDSERNQRERSRVRLFIGIRYRVDGVLHEYLGPARLPGESDIAHVFMRNEWLPDTPGQLTLTLVADQDVDEMVTPTGIKEPRR